MCYKLIHVHSLQKVSKMEKWVGRVALVTGASAGMGVAIAKRLAVLGMKVAGCARNIQSIEVRPTHL